MDQPITDEFKIEAYRILTKRGPWKPTLREFMLAARVCLYTCFIVISIASGSMLTFQVLFALTAFGEFLGHILYRAVEVDRKHKKIIAQLEALRHDQERYMELMNRLVDDIERQRRR